jgi:hypothetical protein
MLAQVTTRSRVPSRFAVPQWKGVHAVEQRTKTLLGIRLSVKGVYLFDRLPIPSGMRDNHNGTQGRTSIKITDYSGVFA